jgi:hypothetical protein
VHPRTTAERLADLLPQAEVVIAPTLRDVLGWSGRVLEFLDRVVQAK